MSAIPSQESRLSLQERYARVRQQSLDLCAPLEREDYQVQPMADASPPKWHLAHITWFFETFILRREQSGYNTFNTQYESLFNSYYNGVGQPFSRGDRGNLSRPTLDEVIEYRRHVDESMQVFLDKDLSADVRFSVELGLHHEQQHQELILTDLKYNLGNNPLKPAYRAGVLVSAADVSSSTAWIEHPGGLVEVGDNGTDRFVFDNETPRHQVYLPPFAIADRAVTNGEFLAFVEDGGYERAELWLSDGWSHLNALGDGRWSAPLYWRRQGADYLEYHLSGEQKLDENLPVCHISGYEADAYARWAGYRLPTEMEWEIVVAGLAEQGNFADSGKFHPDHQVSSRGPNFYGDVWEWTQSGYGPYPGYQPFPGLLGEYNGKFMANQLVLRGGSCATPAGHIRRTYRNFFYPPDRWQFTGIRLAHYLG